MLLMKIWTLYWKEQSMVRHFVTFYFSLIQVNYLYTFVSFSYRGFHSVRTVLFVTKLKQELR